MLEAKVYNQKGKEAGTVTLPENVFGLPWKSDLVHQVVTSMQMSARTPVAHTKDRSEVSGGGKKPWRQKGTGRARHGSSRSPIWVGGGVTHGPRNEKNFDRKVNRKMKAKALYTILSRKLKEGEILFVDNLSLSEPKTKAGREVLSSLSTISGFETLNKKKNNSAYVAFLKKDDATVKSLRNFSNIVLDEVRNINPVSVLKYKFLVITNPDESVKFLTGKFASKKAPISKVKSTRAIKPKKVEASKKKAPAKKVVAK